MIIQKENKLGKGIGYLIAIFIFFSILYFILKRSNVISFKYVYALPAIIGIFIIIIFLKSVFKKW